MIVSESLKELAMVGVNWHQLETVLMTRCNKVHRDMAVFTRGTLKLKVSMVILTSSRIVCTATSIKSSPSSSQHLTLWTAKTSGWKQLAVAIALVWVSVNRTRSPLNQSLVLLSRPQTVQDSGQLVELSIYFRKTVNAIRRVLLVVLAGNSMIHWTVKSDHFIYN